MGDNTPIPGASSLVPGETQHVLIWKLVDQTVSSGVLEYQGKPLQGMKKFRGGLKCSEIFRLVCPETIRANSNVVCVQVTPKRYVRLMIIV